MTGHYTLDQSPVKAAIPSSPCSQSGEGGRKAQGASPQAPLLPRTPCPAISPEEALGRAQDLAVKGGGWVTLGCGSTPEKKPQLPTPPSPSPTAGPSGKLAVVFDFDQCIMKMHMWGRYHNQPLENVIFEDSMFGDLAFFQKVIRELNRQGVVLAIATFGRQDVALKAMTHAFGEGQTLFEESNVLSPKLFNFPDGSDGLGNKNTQLNHIQKEFGVPLADTLFFDDSMNNLSGAKELKASAIFAKPFTAEVWAENSCSTFCQERGFELNL